MFTGIAIEGVEPKVLTFNPILENPNQLLTNLPNKPIVEMSLIGVRNPFIELMMPLFILANEIKNQSEITVDAGLFRQNLLQHINSITNLYKKHKVGILAFTTARYLICCYLDEIILSTQWAKTQRWPFETLLSIFHNDTNGGEKFFVIVQQLLNNPEKNFYLLELAFICLKFGFCGKYKILPRTAEKIAIIEDEIYREIAQLPRQTIDLHQHKPDPKRKKLIYVKYIPMVLIFISLSLIIGLWCFLDYKIENKKNNILSMLNGIVGTSYVVNDPLVR